MRRFRLLPIVIFLAALTLTVKLGDFWQHMEIAMFPTAVASATDRPDDKKAGKTTKKENGGNGTSPIGIVLGRFPMAISYGNNVMALASSIGQEQRDLMGQFNMRGEG